MGSVFDRHVATLIEYGCDEMAEQLDVCRKQCGDHRDMWKLSKRKYERLLARTPLLNPHCEPRRTVKDRLREKLKQKVTTGSDQLGIPR